MAPKSGTSIYSLIFFIRCLCLGAVVFGNSIIPSKEEQRNTAHVSDRNLNTTLPYRLENISNPMVDFKGCGRSSKSWVCDPAGILGETHAARLDGMINDILNNSGCPCANSTCKTGSEGYSISILVVTSIHIPPSSSIFSQLSRWGYTLSSQLWNFGTCGNDIVFVLSKDDDRRLEAYANVLVSERIGGTSCLYKILRGSQPYLYVKNYAAALQYAVHSMKKVLLGGKCPEPKNSTDPIYIEENVNVKDKKDGKLGNDQDKESRDKVSGIYYPEPKNARHSGIQVEERSNKDGVPGLLISDTFFPWWAIVLIVAGAVLAISLLIAMICCCFGGCGGGRGYA